MTQNGRKGGEFSRMSRDELLEFCRSLFQKYGIESLSYPALKKHKSLYPNLYRVGLPQKEVISELGLEDEYRRYCESLPVKRAGGKITYRWTWDRCVQEAKEVKERLSYLPPGGWFQANGHASLVQAVYNLGRTWAELF